MNASGFSADKHDLSRPAFTVMTPIIATNIESGRQSLVALTGLSTGTIYFLRPRNGGKRGISRLFQIIKSYREKPIWRTQPFYLKRKLQSISYHYKRLISFSPSFYDTLIEDLCDQSTTIVTQLRRNRPSSGVIALALAIDGGQYGRYIISGFNFELTHEYARNSDIIRRGRITSPHAETDVMVLQYLARKIGGIYTTEIAVNERANIPFLPDQFL